MYHISSANSEEQIPVNGSERAPSTHYLCYYITFIKCFICFVCSQSLKLVSKALEGDLANDLNLATHGGLGFVKTTLKWLQGIMGKKGNG